MFEIVSTLGKNYYSSYGKLMLESFEKYLEDVPLTVYYDPTSDLNNFKKIKVKSFDIHCGKIWNNFLTFAKPFIETKILNPRHSKKYEKRKEFLYDAVRFSFKALVLIDYYENYFNLNNQYIVWVDGDCIATEYITQEWLESLVSPTCFMSCLLRNHEPGTETGFFILDARSKEGQEWMKQYKSFYYDFKIFNLKYWTDCHALDESRRYVEDNLNGKTYNLSTKNTGDVHKTSKVYERIDHLKGPEKTLL